MKSTKAKLGGSRSVRSVSNKKYGNANTSMVGGRCLYMNSITHPYYLRSCKRSIDSLPDDLISNILLRFPADFLHGTARFVCRRWSLIINSGAFVTTQVQHSTNGLLLSLRKGGGKERPILVTAARGRIKVSQLSYVSRGVLMASSNGLVAELERSGNPDVATFYIVNPATMQSHPLPPLNTNCRYKICGIAFDKLSSKYKLTMLYCESDDAFRLAILTLGVDNSWRKVSMEHVPEIFRFLLLAIPLSIQGFMHWAGSNGRTLLTMDMASEIIRAVKLPAPCRGRSLACYFSTGEFLSLLIFCETHKWEVWGMESETGEWRKVLPDINLRRESQWHQKFVSAGIDYDRELKPVGWVKYPEILAFRYFHTTRECFFYNLYTHRFSCIELPALCSSFRGFMHKNSLVRLG